LNLGLQIDVSASPLSEAEEGRTTHQDKNIEAKEGNKGSQKRICSGELVLSLCRPVQ